MGNPGGHSPDRKRALWTVAVAALAAGFAYYVSDRPMDFRVYHYGAAGVLDGARPVYGPESGLGWPMHYRYPPLFLLLFSPLSYAPIGIGAALWVLLKIAALGHLLYEFRRRPWPAATGSGLLAFLFIAPYVVEEFRYGNVQFFIFWMTAVALIHARTHPRTSASLLALAAAIKVWPLFFFPYLAVRRDGRVVTMALGLTAALTLAPALYFGWEGQAQLLAEWFRQEFSIQLGVREIWFPNQSLRGVLMRYGTVLDYSQSPDSNYPLVHLAAIDPAWIRLLWIVAAGAGYAALLLRAHRRRDQDDWLGHALAFGALVLLQPFSQKYTLAVLLWPAIIAARTATGPDAPRRIRAVMLAAIALALIQPLAPGAAAQRLLQVLGLDFMASALLCTVLVWGVGRERPPRGAHRSDDYAAAPLIQEAKLSNPPGAIPL